MDTLSLAHLKTMPLDELLTRARHLTRERFGSTIQFHVPGMIRCNGICGNYPGISLTGHHCALSCDHCQGKLLRSMKPVTTPQELVDQCLALHANGRTGVLLSGGSDTHGCLPWERYLDAIAHVKHETSLHLSAHTGFIDHTMAHALAEAGVDQALFDVFGDDATISEVYHLDRTVQDVRTTVDAITSSSMQFVPHIVVGLRYGRLSGEFNALELLSCYPLHMLVFVSLMPLPGTPMFRCPLPAPDDIARLLAMARLLLPDTIINMGCARSRGKDSHLIEEYAVDAGVNRLAVFSEEARRRAKAHDLTIQIHRTCCSVADPNFVEDPWT